MIPDRNRLPTTKKAILLMASGFPKPNLDIHMKTINKKEITITNNHKNPTNFRGNAENETILVRARLYSFAKGHPDFPASLGGSSKYKTSIGYPRSHTIPLNILFTSPY